MLCEEALQRRRRPRQLPAVEPGRVELVPERGLRRALRRKVPLAADLVEGRARDLRQRRRARVVVLALQLEGAFAARRPQPALDGIEGDADERARLLAQL